MKLNLILVPLVSAGFALSAFAGTSGKAVTEPVQPPADTTLGATLTVGYDTDYVFRGVEFAKNLVSGSVDWVVPFDKTFSLDLNAWYGASANAEAAPFAGGDSYGELDLSPTLLAKIELNSQSSITFGLKYTWYHYMMNAEHFIKDVNELGLNAKYTVNVGPGSLDVAAGAYHDWTAEGWYFEYSVDYNYTIIKDRLSVQIGVLVSHASHYYGVDGGNTVHPWLALPINLTKTATLSPYIAGNLPFDSLKDAGEEKRVYGGVSLSVTF
jgi:hypothetical protein